MAEGVRPAYLLVDGHSIIHAWDDLRALHARNRRQARVELFHRLTAHHDCGTEHVVLVFDGQGDRVTSERNQPQNIQVLYATAGGTADAVIEKLVSRYAAQFDLTVATGDGAEMMLVTAMGAHWISPEALRDRLDRTRRELDRSLERLRRKK